MIKSHTNIVLNSTYDSTMTYEVTFKCTTLYTGTNVDKNG